MATVGDVSFAQIGSVTFGRRAVEAVPELIDGWGTNRVAIIVGHHIVQHDEVEAIAEALGSRCAAVLEGVAEHTPASGVLDLTSQIRELDADAIVVIGGGTQIDAAKAVRWNLANNVSSLEQILAGRPGGKDPHLPTVRQIAIPTTLSAAEFTGIAGVTNEDTHVKSLWSHPAIAADAVVLDPWMTLSTPEWLLFSTGLRAVDHAVEGYCATSANPYTDTQTSRGFELLTRNLPKVKSDPTDIDARLACQMGAWFAMSGLACGVPMGASHGIGYVLGAAHGVPDGYTSCVMLPAVLRWNAELNSERQRSLLEQSGVGGSNLSSTVAHLVSTLEMPGNLSAIGIDENDEPEIALRSMDTTWVPHNPRPISSPIDVEEILVLAR
jgi:maleylacetate reductase